MHLSKPTECSTPKVNPRVNYGLWVITTCRGRFTDFNKRTTLVCDVDSGRKNTCGDKGHYTFHLILL